MWETAGTESLWSGASKAPRIVEFARAKRVGATILGKFAEVILLLLLPIVGNS